MARIQGDLTVLSAPDLILWLGNRAKTGHLTLEQGAQSKQIDIDRGAALRATSSDPREMLGQFLVNFGLVTEDQLTRAFQTQQETRVVLGRILVMIGTCTEDQVKKTLDFQIREAILNAMDWQYGRFIFDELDRLDRPEGDLGVAVPLAAIHREGEQRARHWQAIRTAFPNEHASLRVHDQRVPPTVRRETFEGRILELARTGLNIESIKIDLHSTDFHFYARLYELHRQGILETRETGPIQPLVDHSPLPSGPHAQLAQQAYEQRDYGAAMRHAEAGLQDEPSDELIELSKKAEARQTEELQRQLPSLNAVPRLIRPIDEILAQRISAKERYILTRIDGTRTVQNIVQISPMREVEASEIFSKLAVEGVIAF